MSLDPIDVDQVFNDASVAAEFVLRQKLEQAMADRQMMMSFLAALIKRNGEEIVFKEDELINTVKFVFSMNEEERTITVRLEDTTEEELREQGLISNDEVG